MKNLLLQIENLTHKKTIDFHADFILDELEKIEERQVVTKEEYFRFLDLTARKEFLTKLTTTEKRTEWAEKVFSILQQTDYGLREMFEQRINRTSG